MAPRTSRPPNIVFFVADDWELVRRNLASRDAGQAATTELYNLASDPVERTDQAQAHPEIVSRLGELARSQHRNSDLFPFPALDKEEFL